MEVNLSKLSLKVRKGKNPILKWDGEVLAKLNRSVFEKFLYDVGIDFPEKSENQTEKVDDFDSMSAYDKKVCAVQFGKAYSEMKRKHYRSRAAQQIKPGDPNFKHLMGAARLCKIHKVPYKKFIRAQVEGLKEITKGRFPTPANLATEQAETRLLEYLRRQDKDEGKYGPVSVEFSKDDKQMPLAKNMKYQDYLRRVQHGIADLKQAVFVAELQKIKKGTVDKEVEEFIDVHSK